MEKNRDTEWFKTCKWGVFCHYLGAPASSDGGAELSADEWNKRVDSFDTKRLADQLRSANVKYFFITIGQNSGHYCAPNATYDLITGIEPSKCSTRDLISDLYDALAPLDIKLMVYITNSAPGADLTAIEKLQWEWGYEGGWPNGWQKRTGKRLTEFQLYWEKIIREWSLRWGNKISGWWVDGCYFNDEMYRFPNQPNFDSFLAAIRAGNPDSIVALNTGVKKTIEGVKDSGEDYTAGEFDFNLPVPGWNYKGSPIWTGSMIDGEQFHILTYLGQFWGQGTPRFPMEFLASYTKMINSCGGVITWDVPITFDGKIPANFMEQLKSLDAALHSHD